MCASQRQRELGDRTMARGRVPRRESLRLSALTLAAALLNGCDPMGGIAGGRSQFRVAGRSMLPTLFPRYREASCPRCRILVRLPLAALANPLSRSPKAGEAEFPCWHCGHAVPKPDGPAAAGHVVDVIEGARLAELPQRREAPPLRPGDLVAIRSPEPGAGRLTVKRVFGLPGSVIGLADGRLTCDGIRLEDRAAERVPSLPVDLDHHRNESRWNPVGRATISAAPWQRRNREWTHPGGDSPWLRYTHRSVYEYCRPGPVRDDYPWNVDVTRRLQPVDRLSVRCEVSCRGPGHIQLVQWHREGNRMSELEVPERAAGSEIGLGPSAGRRIAAADFTGAAVSPQSPLAIRLSGGREWRLRELSVRRRVEYRTGPSDDRDRYPLTLSEGEYFVVGDNVPISRDSRHWGGVGVDRIVGRVEIGSR